MTTEPATYLSTKLPRTIWQRIFVGLLSSLLVLIFCLAFVQLFSFEPKSIFGSAVKLLLQEITGFVALLGAFSLVWCISTPGWTERFIERYARLVYRALALIPLSIILVVVYLLIMQLVSGE